jgi:hypothetical protein
MIIALQKSSLFIYKKCRKNQFENYRKEFLNKEFREEKYPYQDFRFWQPYQSNANGKTRLAMLAYVQ